MTTDTDAGLAQSSRPPVIDAAQAAGITPPPGAFAPRPRFMPAPAAIPQAETALAPAPAPEPAPDVLDMLRAQPVPAAETAVQAVQAAPAPIAPADPAPAAVAPSPANAAVIESDRQRSQIVPLAWPVRFAGKLYASVTRSRPSSKQVGDYFERLIAQKDGDPDLRFPIFYDDAGAPIPEEVWDAMDDDDRTALLTELDDFLPVRLRRLQASAPAVSTQDDGAATGPTS